MDFSRVKTVVHPDYAYLEDFVRRLPQEDFPVDRVFCDRRNTVVATHDQGIPMVVKKYARPTVFNCFVYTFFRPTKAKRAYRYAMRLERCGLLSEHISVTDDCTACLPKKYWSHRATGGVRGSQAAVIQLL